MITIAMLVVSAFLYHDKVEVVDGFYKGCRGTVERLYYDNGDASVYEVLLKKCGQEEVFHFDYFDETELRRIK